MVSELGRTDLDKPTEEALPAMSGSIKRLVKDLFDLTVNKLWATPRALSSGGIRRKIALCCNVSGK